MRRMAWRRVFWRWLGIGLLAVPAIVEAGKYTCTVTVSPKRDEWLKVFPEDPEGARPTCTFTATAVVSVTNEDGTPGEELTEDPCTGGETDWTYGWGAGGADIIAGGGPKDPFITIRARPGTDTVGVSVGASITVCSVTVGSSDSGVVVVPTWNPADPITPGDATAKRTFSALSSPAGAKAGPGAITAPLDQALVAAGATVGLAGSAHDPRDKRIGKDTTETGPVGVLPAWWPPACGTLAGGTVDAAGRHTGAGVAWTAPPPADGAADDCTSVLPSPIGVAKVAIAADFVDTTELAGPRENGTSLDPVLTDMVVVHVPDAAIAADPCCVPYGDTATATLSWAVGPALQGLGGSGEVWLAEAPAANGELPQPVPLKVADFTVADGAATPGQVSWDPTGWPPGEYTFTLSWGASLNGGPVVPVTAGVTVTVFKVEIADLDGTVPAARQVVCVGRTASFMAKVTPDGFPGSFAWETGDALRLSIPGATDASTVEVKGEKADDAVPKVPLTVEFTPACSGVPATASHRLTVADVRIRGKTGGDPDTVICVNCPAQYLGRRIPDGLPGTFTWTPETDMGRLLIVSSDPATGEVLCHGGMYHSPTKGAETLRVQFVPDGVPAGEGAEAELAVTIADVEIRGGGTPPTPPEFIGAGQTMPFKAAPLPDGIAGGYAWSTGSADLKIAPSGSTAHVTAVEHPASTGPHTLAVVFTPNGGGNCSRSADHKVSIIVADLDVDSDNDEGYVLLARSEAEDAVEEDSSRPGKVVPANRADWDRDGVPDFADGYNLQGFGDVYATTSCPFVPMVLELKGVTDPGPARFRFDYALSSPTGVLRAEAPDWALVYRARSDPSLSAPGFRFYSYTVPGGAMRVWKQPGGATRDAGTDLIMPGTWYAAADLGIGGTMATTLFVEGVSAVDVASIVCTVEYGTSPETKAETADEVRVSVVELEAGVNTNNDREFIIDLTDDAIEDQGNGFLFWPSRDDDAEVTAEGIVDLMPARFALPQSLLTAGFLPYLRMVGPQDSRIDLYRNDNQADNTAYLKDATVGRNQVAASRLVALESEALLPMNQADEQWLLKFPGTGVYTLYLGIETPGGARLVGDSVRVTVREPSSFYWYGSARGSQSVAFAYPVDSPGYVTVQRFPDVALVGDDNRDWTKQKHFVFLHGFNNDTGEAREWNNEMLKRLYWTGYRDNYLGITWFGDEGPDILPVLPDVEEYNFDLDVENALHTSPSVYLFLRDTVAGAWGVAPADINIMAHSLGNLVMWDALRLNAHLNTGAQLVNNVLSSEAAVWPETFAPPQSLVYSAPGDDPVTYTASELIQHSWSFWFRQAGREAASSAAQVFHSYVEHDSALHTMRFNDKVKRGTVGFGGLEHYYRGSVNSFPNDRSPETLHNTPTLMLPGHRRLVLGQYDREDLNLPIGTQASPVTLRNVDPYATGMGWEQEEHSDLRYQPFFRIYTWYDQFVRLAADVP